MYTNLLDLLEKANREYPNRVAYKDDDNELTFAQVKDKAKAIGSLLCRYTQSKSPVAVLSSKSVDTPALYLGVAFAGCHYVPLGADLPPLRLKLILDTLKPDILLTDGKNQQVIESLDFQGTVVVASEAEQMPVDEEQLASRRRKMIDTDPLYIIFTSGSSGVPKGVVTPHRAVVDYIVAFVKTFGLDENVVFGNQAPLDYDAAIRDMYIPLLTGAKTVLIPKALFSSPLKLFEYVNGHDINTLFWVAAALSFCAELGTFDAVKLDGIDRVFFIGSVLHCKHLRVWQENLPNTKFVNHYGTTEITASCTYYEINERVQDTDVLPIGIPFENTDVFLLDENNQSVPDGEQGEICVRGTCLALGYYKNPEKTNEVFIPNPLHDNYNELIYKTGDLGIIQPDGNLAFHGRKDSQIKHMGYRIELGEIQATAGTMPKVDECCCLYKHEKEQIWLFYTGDADNRELAVYLREHLPFFMLPRKYVCLDAMPKSFNGKIDMENLRKRMYEDTAKA